ncbi:hypothetical protein L7F22_009040 [Adiantum nelumboides]|nr:hypothetical protein [Adiantum nelumboides]
MGFGHRRMDVEACGSGTSGDADDKVEVITNPLVGEQKAKKERSREKEKEKTKLRERHRRSITSNILAGLRRYGNYNLPIRADINDVIKALAREAGWTVEADGTTFRSKSYKGISDPVIILPNLLKPFVVQCDACGNNLGAVLMQDGQVVAYESRVSSTWERTLQVYEKEMLAVMHAPPVGSTFRAQEHYLPLVEYAYNNTVHTSTGKALFEIKEGGKKVPPILQTTDKIFEADKYVQNTDEAYRKIKLALEKTQSKQKKAVDCHRRELIFSLGDWVLLRFEKARSRKMKGKERLFPKLSMRYYGLFQVCDKISDVAYRLKLPEGWKIHTAFHVSLLRPFIGEVLEDVVPEEQHELEELDKNSCS